MMILKLCSHRIYQTPNIPIITLCRGQWGGSEWEGRKYIYCPGRQGKTTEKQNLDIAALFHFLTQYINNKVVHQKFNNILKRIQPKPALTLGFKHANLFKPPNTANLQPGERFFLIKSSNKQKIFRGNKFKKII